ncbi:Uncharacterized protein dnm_048160 [Desulfonema magnum]|uniref:Uncharacterized protein n=1 Tax=Desulfonema magnum TaxID=45655 RepID=A0A975GPF2_9BACT|nr:Uncharacterized protein dnm_048160 [Desulfonema magnum]
MEFENWNLFGNWKLEFVISGLSGLGDKNARHDQTRKKLGFI